MDLHRELGIVERLSQLEAKVDFLLRHFNLEANVNATPPPDLDHLEDLLRRGEKLEAVRRYRDRTGLSLTEAAKAIEAIEHANR